MLMSGYFAVAFVCLHSKYIVDFNCTSNYSTRKILDAQKSFPSGHTSVSAFAAAFMVVSVLHMYNS